ncbi:hypothetical protein [Mucilaginibacter psychrotolerans]|uniref:Uncharacterized protein n=1 Tax=Mucilaginibacter psychrotolerans TaxID=1524096 RepID=A0A4Y8SQB3_9SPHI|nr:hypothetical protein [Mucilaginibacter psychrotolerans]TFF40644.1 hypothetical protein E2R66_00215 [Mucilaginibacter psychrotolerans]
MNKEDNQDDITSKIIGLLPLITIIVLGSGTLNIFIYYRLFGINILAHLDIGELLPLSLSDTIDVLLELLIILFIIFILKLTRPKPRERKKPCKILKYKDRFFYHSTRELIIGFVIICVSLTIIYFSSFDLIYFMNYYFSAIVCVMSVFICLIVSWLIKTIYPTISDKFRVLFFVSTILFFNNGYMGLKKNVDVRFGDAYTGTYVATASDTIKSTQSYYYIGRTKSDILFYNNSKKRSSVDFYSIESLKKISITNW